MIRMSADDVRELLSAQAAGKKRSQLPETLLQERAVQAQRAQGQRNRAQGASFERLIEQACDYYRAKGIADIEKTPEPMQPVKDLGGGKFIAHYTAAAQADYKGFLKGGRAVNFEAKHTDTGRMDQSRVTDDQAERLEQGAWIRAGSRTIRRSVWRGRTAGGRLPLSSVPLAVLTFFVFPGRFGGT